MSFPGCMFEDDVCLLVLKATPTSVSLELERASHVSLELECARGTGERATSEVLELSGVG